MKAILRNGKEYNSSMSLYEIRKWILNQYDAIYSDKIRLYSIIYKESLLICWELWIDFSGYFLAIWEFNPKSFTIDLQEKWGFLSNGSTYEKLRETYKIISNELIKDWISEFQYDLTGVGYKLVRKELQMEQKRRIGIEFYTEDSGEFNEIFFVNGASFWLKVIFETLYRKLDRRARVLFPLPMFMPIISASDIFLNPILYPTQDSNKFKITPYELQEIIKNEDILDWFYLCPLNNPTSILYSGDEIYSLLKILIDKYPNIRVIIDNVYAAWWNSTEIHEIFQKIEKNGWMKNIFIIDGEGKAKARTGKRSGVLLIKNKEDSILIANIIRNTTGWPSSDSLINTLASLRSLDKDLPMILYKEIQSRRESFLTYIFNNEQIREYLEPLERQHGLTQWISWQWWLYAFIKLKEWVEVTEFILNTGIIGSPGNIFWSEKYKNYIRLSFWYESFNH